MESGVVKQKESFELVYSDKAKKLSSNNNLEWSGWDSKDPLTKYVIEKRIRKGIDYLFKKTKSTPADWDVLVVCGGIGGEGTFLANYGFRSVSVSDISENALEVCHNRDPRLKTCLLDAEHLEIPEEKFDLVIVQDGLHHLPRPVLGLTEMLRVAKRAVIVIEPHEGLIANTFGRAWEYHGETVNYVFRWNKLMFKQATLSYLLQAPCTIKAMRLWSHGIKMSRIARKSARFIGYKKAGPIIAKSIYTVLDSCFGWLGNAMVGVVIKESKP